MLGVWTIKNSRIDKIEKTENELFLHSEAGIMKLIPVDERTVRVVYSVNGAFAEGEKPGLVEYKSFAEWDSEENDKYAVLKMPCLRLKIDRETFVITYCDGQGEVLLKERSKLPRELSEYEAFMLAEGEQKTSTIETADGVKTVVTDPAKVSVGKRYHTRLNLEFGDEALYGLGQHEEGFANLRGKTVYVHQGNRKIAIPLLVSTKGWGILSNSYCPMIFSDTDFGSYIYTESDYEMDYFFINGDTPDGIIKEYRQLTGKAALLPKWAFGYIQSQERYETSEELIEATERTRAAGAGIDCIVQDWISWGPNQWGQKTWDSERYPDPVKMCDKLHELHTHLMVSIWPNMDPCTDNHKEFAEKGLFLPASNTYNAFAEEARDIYGRQAIEGLWRTGIDAWWCDNCEPYAPEWERPERPEPAVLYNDYCRDSGYRMPPELMNAFALYHTRAVYEAQRKETEKQRVCNLARSASTGQQKYATILWSGDTEATWKTLSCQIGAGINFCAAGMPYWTVDIGAFFVKTGNQWYWRGDYHLAEQDLGYKELYTRWFEWAAFLPVFRAHGTDCRREIYHFGKPGDIFFDALLKYNRLRYTLMPYIYSLAGLSWLRDESIMRPLAFEYPECKEVWNIRNQYMFGPAFLVCPVTRPMYYGVDSTPIENDDHKVSVYLPEGKWYLFEDNTAYEGGRSIEIRAEIDNMPVFVKAGSIVPMTDFALSTEEQTEPVRLKIYAGADGEFSLYEDSGDGYGYEKGEYTLTELRWCDDTQTLLVNGKENEHFEIEVVR